MLVSPSGALLTPCSRVLVTFTLPSCSYSKRLPCYTRARLRLAGPLGSTKFAPGARGFGDPWCGWVGNFEPGPRRARFLNQMAYDFCRLFQLLILFSGSQLVSDCLPDFILSVTMTPYPNLPQGRPDVLVRIRLSGCFVSMCPSISPFLFYFWVWPRSSSLCNDCRLGLGSMRPVEL